MFLLMILFQLYHILFLKKLINFKKKIKKKPGISMKGTQAAIRKIRSSNVKPNTIMDNGQEAGLIAYRYILRRTIKIMKKNNNKKIKRNKKTQKDEIFSDINKSPSGIISKTIGIDNIGLNTSNTTNFISSI